MVNLKRMKFTSDPFLFRSLIFISVFNFQYFHDIYCQTLDSRFEWKVEDVMDAVADISGNVYISTYKGTVHKFNANGVELLSYSGNLIAPINSLDVSHTTKIFGFFKEDQFIIILDRFLNPVTETFLKANQTGNATLASFSADNNLWVFDQSSTSLRKINLMNDMIMTTITLQLIFNYETWNIIQMEEYQNRLYLYAEGHDVIVLDNLGNLIKKLPIQPDQKFSFAGSSMIYVQSAVINGIDIYSNEIREIGRVTETNDILKVISANNLIYLVLKNKIIAY